MGISGLAARVRREIVPTPTEPRMTSTRQFQEQIYELDQRIERSQSTGKTLHRFGLVVDEDGDLVVIDEEKFETWLAARRRPRALIEGRAE